MVRIKKVAEIVRDAYNEYYTKRIVAFRIEDDKLEIYFTLSKDERDMLDEYVVDEVYFDNDAKPSLLVIRFRKR